MANTTDRDDTFGEPPFSLKELRRAETQAEIERVAIELASNSSFDEISVAEIAAEVGIAERTFFRYFPSKDDVLLDSERRFYEELGILVAARPMSEGPVVALTGALTDASSSTPMMDGMCVRHRVFSAAPIVQARAYGEQVAATRVLARVLLHRGQEREDLGVSTLLDRDASIISVCLLGAAYAQWERWSLESAQGDRVIEVKKALDVVCAGISSIE